MVTRIRTSKNIARILRYNEQKLETGAARLLHAGNFLKDVHALSPMDKLGYFQKYLSLNQRTGTNALHVSLNFDPSEQLDEEKLIGIAQAYIDRIGFGEQPYLVYQHFDAGHPHIHVVTTNIRLNGARISMHNLGRLQSEVARKSIEADFSLVKAQSNAGENRVLKPINLQRIQLGKMATKQAINKVLEVVLDRYCFNSLPELNALLGCYNLIAERGAPGSRMFEGRGLVFQVIDETGHKISAPVKASAFHMQPTLAALERKFKQNRDRKQELIIPVRRKLNWALHKKDYVTWQGLVAALTHHQISVMMHQSADGYVYGVTFVDHQHRVVFNGSDLGPKYAARCLMEHCSAPAFPGFNPSLHAVALPPPFPAHTEKNAQVSTSVDVSQQPQPGCAPAPFDFVPAALKRKRKKKRTN